MTSFLARYYPITGDLVWAYPLVGSGDLVINDIVVDPMGEIGVVGNFAGSADLDPTTGDFHATSKGDDDIFLLRLYPDGTLDWGWTNGGKHDDHGLAIATDRTSAFYITGYYEGDVDWKATIPPNELGRAGGTDVFIGRFNNAGFFFWVDVFGGKGDDTGTDIGVDAKGYVYSVGTFTGLADLDPKHTSTDTRSHGRDDIFISVVDKDSKSAYQTSLGGPGNESNAKILVKPDGTFYLAGQFENTADLDTHSPAGDVASHGGTDIFLSYFGLPGAHAFQWGYGLGGVTNDTLAGFVQEDAGDLYLLGDFGGTVDFDPGPATTEVTSSGAADIFVGVYSDQFQFRQVQTMVNPQQDRAGALAISPISNVIFGGAYSGSIDLGSGLSVSSGQPDGVFSLFLARYASPLQQRAYLPGLSSSVTAK